MSAHLCQLLFGDPRPFQVAADPHGDACGFQRGEGVLNLAPVGSPVALKEDHPHQPHAPSESWEPFQGIFAEVLRGGHVSGYV